MTVDGSRHAAEFATGVSGKATPLALETCKACLAEISGGTNHGVSVQNVGAAQNNGFGVGK